MKLKWTDKALSDLSHLYQVLASANQPAAVRTIQALTAAPTVLLTTLRMGKQLSQFEPRYELQGETIYLLRLWHTR